MRLLTSLLLAATLALGTAGALAAEGDWSWDATLRSHFEYYDDEDLFGGSYAPFYQFLEASLDYQDKARVYAYMYTTKDLESSESWHSDIYSLYLELEDLGPVGRLKLGRFLHTGGVDLQVLDGGDMLLLPADDVEVELFLGRSKVFYDSRYDDTLLWRAPYTETGVNWGGRAAWRPHTGARVELGYSGFDAGQDADPQHWLSYEASAAFDSGLRLDLRGHQELSDDSGSELHASLIWDAPSGLRLQADAHRVQPDRINPDIITSVLVADDVWRVGGGAELPLGERLRLFGDYGSWWFDAPGGEAPQRRSDSLRLGLRGNLWLSHGFEAAIWYRWLDGEAGRIHEIGSAGDKRLWPGFKLGWALDWVDYKRGGEAGDSAWRLAGRAHWYLRPDLWIIAELENYANVDFDYNLRTRVTLNYRLSDDQG